MAGKQLKASIIIDLTGNVMQKAGAFGSAIDRMVKRNSASIKALGSDINYLSSSFDKFGTRAAMGITAAGVAIDRTFVKTAAMYERYQIQSSSLFGGPEKGKQAMNWAVQNAKDTVLSLTQVMELMTEMKGFGMDPMNGTLMTMENVAAQHGWTFDKLHGAMAQIEQMYAKQKISMDDAKILSAYGVNIYQELSKATGIDQKRIMALGSKGKLGNKALAVFFKQLDKESKGASASAMKTWDGLMSNLGDDWSQWQENVMNRGVFDKLKNKARQFKALVENPDKANAAAHNTAATLNHSIDMATAGAEGLWEVFKGIGTTIDKTSSVLGDWAVKLGIADAKAKSTDKSLTGVKYLVEGMAALWLGNKAIRMGAPVAKTGWILGKGAYKTGKGIFKGGRWGWRKIFGGGRPEIGDVVGGGGGAGIPAAAGVMRVFVTNWPRGGLGGDGFSGDFGGDGKGKKSRRKKGPGKGRGRFSRIFNAGEEILEDAEKVGGGGAWNRIKSIFKGAGKAAKAVPLLGTAVTAVEVATADSNAERGSAIGGNIGMWAGGALGTLTDEFTGPFGTIVGAQIGQSIGDEIGSMIGSWFDDKKDDKPADKPTNGRIDLNLNLPAGMTLGSSMQVFGGDSPINLMTGGYLP